MLGNPLKNTDKRYVFFFKLPHSCNTCIFDVDRHSFTRIFRNPADLSIICEIDLIFTWLFKTGILIFCYTTCYVGLFTRILSNSLSLLSFTNAVSSSKQNVKSKLIGSSFCESYTLKMETFRLAEPTRRGDCMVPLEVYPHFIPGELRMLRNDFAKKVPAICPPL